MQTLWSKQALCASAYRTQRRVTRLLLGVLLWSSALYFSTGVAQADVSYIGSVNEVITTASDDRVRLNPPAAALSGDLLVAHIVVRTSVTVTPPSGWTLLLGPISRGNVREYIWYRFLPSTTLPNQDFIFSGNSRAVTGVSVWRGADSSNPISAFGSNVGTSPFAIAPSRPVASGGSQVLALFAGDDGNDKFINASPGTNSDAWSDASGGGVGNGVAGAALYRPISAPGASGTTIANYVNDDWIASTLIISPSALTCFSDQFDRSTGLGSDWATSSSSGAFGAPRIVGNWLRLTDASSNVATAATLQRLFPADGNFVRLEFTLFDDGGSGADGIAVTFSDATVTPQPGGYGGSLGYAQRSGINGFAGGWLGIGLDEFGNFLNTGEGRGTGGGTPGTGCISGGTQRRDSVAVRGSGSGTNGYRCLAATGTLNPEVDNTPAGGHRYRVTIDARSDSAIPVTVERDSGTGYNTLISIPDVKYTAGQAAIPDNFYLSLTGSTGGSTNIHEIDNLSVCASSLNSVGTQIDHFRFLTDGQALTCTPKEITLLACMDASCNTTYPGAVTATLTGTGWVGGNSVSFSGGSTTLQLQRTTVGSTAIGVSSSTPPLKPLAVNRCFNGSTAIPCSVAFADSGFVFDVPDLTANKPVSNILVRAVKKDDASQRCVPAFSGVSRDLRWYSTYSSPATGGMTVQLNDISIATAATGTAFSHAFNANGETSIKVLYADAGQLTLNASYSGSAATGDAGLVMTGSDLFVSRPAGFCVQARTPIATPTGTLANCADSSCPAYQRAGVNFPLRVQAMAWQVDGETDSQFCTGNDITPNFAGAVTLTHDMPDSLIEGSFSQPSVTLSAGTLDTNANFSEVGRFVLSTGGTYIGGALPVSRSDHIGRITPDHYDITLNAFAAHCTDSDDFSYAGLTPDKNGELFALGTQVRAVNASSAVTLNYVGGYARLQGQALTFSDFNGVNPAVDGQFVSAAHSLLFGSGATAGIATNDPSLDPTTSPINGHYQLLLTRAPYNVGLRADAIDGDGIIGSSAVQGPVQFRLGRLILENAYGPEQLPLPIPLRAEYFDGSRWRANDADFCSRYRASDGSLSNFGGTLTMGDTTLTTPVASTELVNGRADPTAPLRLSAPGLGENGSLTVTLTVPDWLRFDWNGDNSHTDNPTATASFGRYRGSDRVIYWRERLPAQP